MVRALTPSRRWRTWHVVLLTVVVVLVFGGCLFPNHVRSLGVRLRIERELASITTPTDRSRPWRAGFFAETKSGDWIAVRYADSHSFPAWSISIARDSGSMWWESDEHFCGEMFIHAMRETSPERYAEMLADAEPGSVLHAVAAIEASPDLDTARQHLIALGFRPMR
jgi:hypothetical protein